MTKEQQKLVEDNHNVIYSFLNKYNLSHDDWYDLAAIGLCKAAKSFKDDISNFSTYAYKCMFTTVFQEKRKETRLKTIPSYKLDHYDNKFLVNESGETISYLETIESKNNTETEALFNIQVQNLIGSVNYIEKKVLSLIMKGYSQQEIASIIGCSQPKISRILKNMKKLI